MINNKDSQDMEFSPNKASLTIYWQVELASIKTQILGTPSRLLPGLAKPRKARCLGESQQVVTLIPTSANYLTI